MATADRPRDVLVMVATDFSDTAVAATAWGAEIATSHDGRILLVHALHVQGPMSDYLPVTADLGEELRNAARERLDSEAGTLRTQGVEVDVRLEIGLPSQSILRVAEELSPDLLVLGTRGLSGFRHLLLGSTAERVVQRAPCPVLTVHPEDREEHRPLRSILVPTDFSEDARRAAATGQRLLSHLEEGAELTLLHAYHLPIEYTAYGTIPTGLSFREDVVTVAEQRLNETAAELEREGLTVHTAAREGYPPEVIVAVAEEIDADLVVMGTHGRTGLRHLLLGSNAERVVQHAPCPVLTVRHPEE